MGTKFSKKSKVPTTPSTSNNNGSGNSSSNGSNSITSNDLNFYLAACQNDLDVKIFDSKLQQHANAVVNSLTTDNTTGFDQQVCSLSFDSLTQVTGSLMDMNYEVVKVILDCKNDIWKNKELLYLVEDYLSIVSKVQTLDSQCLKRARDRHLIIQLAMRRFEEEMRGNDDDFNDVSEKFSNTLKEFKSFNEAGDPFGQEFFTIFQSVYTQVQLCCDLFCSCRRIAAPPLASAVSAPIGGVGRWFNRLWKKYDEKLKGEKDLLLQIQLGTLLTVKDFDNIRVLVEKLEIVIDSLLSNAEFALRETDTLTMVMYDIKNMVSVFMEGMDSITSHSEKYSKEIRQARTVILHRIMKYPSAPI